MSKILMIGSKGDDVRELQRLLNAYLAPHTPLNVDGDFGGGTDRAVRSAQDQLGLVVDGKAGPQTMRALTQATTKPEPAAPEPNKSAINVPIVPAPTPHADPAAPLNAANVVLLDTDRPINEIIFHCTATPEGKSYTVEDIRSWHKQRGWTDIGYHYVVDLDGRVLVGRPVGQIGSHVAGKNTGTIGIAYIGGLTSDTKSAKDTRTEAQRSSLLWLRDQLRAKHRGIRTFSGHNEYAAKACPCFNVKQDALGKVT